MQPIVHGLKEQYAGCLAVERVNYHARTEWHELLSPIGSPEFTLLTSAKEVIHRWFGVTPADEFSAVIDPLCG